MNHKPWFREVAAVAILLSGTACTLGVSVGVSNTPESPERKPRITLLQVNDNHKIKGLNHEN